MHARSVTLAIYYIATGRIMITGCFFRLRMLQRRGTVFFATHICTAASSVPRFNTAVHTRVGTLNRGLDHLCGYCIGRTTMAPLTTGTRSRPVTFERLARPVGIGQLSPLRRQFHCALVLTSAVPYLVPIADCHRTIND